MPRPSKATRGGRGLGSKKLEDQDQPHEPGGGGGTVGLCQYGTSPVKMEAVGEEEMSPTASDVSVEEEEPLANYLKCEIGEEDHDPQPPRPPSSSSSFCFVCVTPLPSNSNSTRTREKVTQGDCLCLLKDLLQLPEPQFQYYLDLMKEPEELIGFCSKCLDLIREAGKVKEQLIRLEEELGRCQREVVGKMKGTKVNSVLGMYDMQSVGVTDSQRMAVENILRFVHYQKYRSLFVGGTKSLGRSERPQIGRPNKPSGPGKPTKSAQKKTVVAEEDDAPDEMTGSFWEDPLGTEEGDFGDFSIPEPSPPCQSTTVPPQPSPPPTGPGIDVLTRKRGRPKRKQAKAASESDEDFVPKKQLRLPRKKLETNKNVSPAVPKRKAGKRLKSSSRAEESKSSSESETEEDEGADLDRKNKKGAKCLVYDCPACPAVTNYDIDRFTQHLHIHRRKPYKCSVCSTFLPDDGALLEQHWNQNHSTVELPAPSSSSGANLSLGKFSKLDYIVLGEIWKCDGCPNQFHTEDARDKHERNCSSSSIKGNRDDYLYSCMTCQKPSRNKDEWRLHRALHHPEVDLLSCFYCDASLAVKTRQGGVAREVNKLRKHIRQEHPYSVDRRQPRLLSTHDECESCGLVFARTSESKSHFLKEHGIPLGGHIYSCSLCQKGFRIRTGLDHHLAIQHFPRELLICDQCGTEFKRGASLDEHKLREHGIQPDVAALRLDSVKKVRIPELKACPVEGCDFKSTFREVIEVHTQKVHGGTRKFTCRYCGKGFLESNKLKVHEELHENKEKKPYQCDLCGSSFAVRNNLYMHKRVTHEGRSYGNKGPSTSNI